MWSPALGSNKGPLYRAIADAVAEDVRLGRLRPGQRLPTHRELADALGVTVSTATRGYLEAERRGLVSGTVGRGTFVAADAATACSMVQPEPFSLGLIEMGLVTPLTSHDPDVAGALKRLARRKDLESFLHYHSPRGLPEHRAAGADWIARYGLEVSPDSVVVCAGSQHGLTCALTALFRPGQRLATDCLIYPGLKTLANLLGIRLAPVAMDDQGMVPEDLEAVCRRESIQGLYCMPSVQNPTTAHMGHERRAALAGVAEKHDLTIIEDDAYALTLTERPAPLAALAPERTLFIAGMSKVLGGGLRVAFMASPPAFRARLADAVLNTVWMTPALTTALAAMWIKDGTADAVPEARLAQVLERRALADEILRGLDYAGHGTGFYVWLNLPEPWTGAEFEERARQARLNVFGAERFAVGNTRPPRAVRLSLTGPATPAELGQGLSLVREILAGHVPLSAPLL